MKTRKRLLSVLLSVLLVITCFTASLNITVGADSSEIYKTFSENQSVEGALYFLQTYIELDDAAKAQYIVELAEVNAYLSESFCGEATLQQILSTYGDITNEAYTELLSDEALNAVNAAYDTLRPRADGASIKANSEANLSFYALRPQYFDSESISAEDIKSVRSFGAVMDFYESVVGASSPLTRENAATNIAKVYPDDNTANIDVDLNFALDTINIRLEEHWDTLISARFYVVYLVNGVEYTVYSNNEILNPVPSSFLTAGTCIRSINGVMDTILSLLKENYDDYKYYKGTSVTDIDGEIYDRYSSVPLSEATGGNTEYEKETRTDTLYFLMSYNSVINAIHGLSDEGYPIVQEKVEGPQGTDPEDSW